MTNENVTSIEKLKAVQEYVEESMQAQGASLIQAVNASVKVYFFNSSDIDNLYACINSELPENVKGAIVAHDFNGLSNHDTAFLPKSTQFATK